MKRQRFLANQAAGGRGPEVGRRAPPSINTGANYDDIGRGGSPMNDMPNSPLSQLVQGGYQPAAPPSPQRQTGSAALPPRVPGLGRPPSGGGQGGFTSGVAQQWNNNVQQNTAAYQQQHDPNYVAKYTKPNGYRVNQAPGGGSSISLSWGGGNGGGDDPSPGSAGGASAASRFRSPGVSASSPGSGGGLPGFGGDAAAAYQHSGMRARSPHSAAYADGCGGRGRGPSPGGGMAACMGGGRPPSQSPNDAYGRGPSPADPYARGPSPGPTGMAACLGGDGGMQSYQPSSGSSVRGRSPHTSAMPGGARDYGNHGSGCAGGGMNYGAPPRQESGMVFGSRASGSSSNAYASGANQNCGNFMTDRRTTRVAKPPGGGSQISFG